MSRLCPSCGRNLPKHSRVTTPETGGTVNNIVTFIAGKMMETGRSYVSSLEIGLQFSFLTTLQINSRLQSGKRTGKIVSGPKRGTYKLPVRP